MDMEVSSARVLNAFRSVPRTGVIYVTEKAQAKGFVPGHPDWCNLGQGQPETGPLPGAPPRPEAVSFDPVDQDYAPVAGLWELRQAVAELYNHLFRRGMKSQYKAENVAISGGGRASLTRACAALGPINLGHFLPDYTAYEELLDIFRMFTPIPILLDPEQGYAFTARDLRREVLGRGVAALLMSNPCNPIGKVVRGEQLAQWVDAARELDCALLLDEFYSHYVWQPPPGGDDGHPIISAARYVENVDKDPIILFDGLTKNWRYPGWRITWTVGPRSVIESISSAGSFLDGGGSRPLQHAAIELLQPSRVLAEAQAIRDAFLPKRDLMLSRTRQLGLGLDLQPDGTFYAFASLRDLPAPLSDGMAFFERALEHKVICVPGVFFDVNPGRRRARHISRFHQYVRLSYGPRFEEVEAGLQRLETMICEARG